MNEFQKAQNAKILSCYNTDETLSDLQKAEILDIEKGGKRALIGEKRTFGGREYIKTADGWKFHGKGTGTKAQEHVAGATAKTEEKQSANRVREIIDRLNQGRQEMSHPDWNVKANELHKEMRGITGSNSIVESERWLESSSKPTETPKTEKVAEEKKDEVSEIEKLRIELRTQLEAKQFARQRGNSFKDINSRIASLKRRIEKLK